jgi:N-methylhydantoinase B
MVSGRDPRRDGARFVDMMLVGITGGPGHAWGDGWLTHSGGCSGMNVRDSTEISELLRPLRIEDDRVVPNTEGAGRNRGVPSNRVEYVAVDTPVELVWTAEGSTNGAQGVRGGLGGQAGRQAKRLLDGSLEPLAAFSSTVLEPGEALVSYSGAGGGYGPPPERDPEQVAFDVHEGWITRERAAEVYGVVLADDGTVDSAATTARRASNGRDA